MQQLVFYQLRLCKKDLGRQDLLLIAKLSRIPVSMLYLNAEPLCYCVARSRSYLKFFSISILCPYFHCRGQEPLCVSIPMQMQPPAQPSDLAHSSKPSSTLSRLDIKTQTLASQPQRYEVWCSNQCTVSIAELFTSICSISRLQ